ncbi:MAG: general secretion pathway protein GspC, partial [Myxococcaceae bacterium]|nr:general secretion pathway protein GspC [Myxococcaceae bacterium]
MEFLFKRHFWLVHLAFMFGVAFFVGKTANAFIEAGLLPLPSGEARQVVKPQLIEPVPQLTLDRLAKLTGLPVPKPEPEVKEPEKPVEDLTSPPVHTSLRLKLLGTLVSESNPQWSVASIQDVVTLKTNTYMVGDVVQGAEVLEIERKRVIVKHNNRREFIDENPGDGSAAPPPPPPVQTIAAAPVKYNDQPPPAVG